ncbi:MAG: response regulator [Cyclobacteriaceae bacterium]
MQTYIFIIDDDPIFRRITVKMISKLDKEFFIIKECEDGEIGIKELERLSNSEERIIIFLDINMPVLNGWEFLDKLIQNENYNIKDVRVFIVSSSTDKIDIIKAQNYPLVKQFIHKPMDLITIKAIVSEL